MVHKKIANQDVVIQRNDGSQNVMFRKDIDSVDSNPITVGSAIKCYWRPDKKFYYGTVIEMEDITKACEHKQQETAQGIGCEPREQQETVQKIGCEQQEQQETAQEISCEQQEQQETAQEISCEQQEQQETAQEISCEQREQQETAQEKGCEQQEQQESPRNRW